MFLNFSYKRNEFYIKGIFFYLLFYYYNTNKNIIYIIILYLILNFSIFDIENNNQNILEYIRI